MYVLDQRLCYILEARYWHKHTYKQIASVLGVCPSRVQQLDRVANRVLCCMVRELNTIDVSLISDTWDGNIYREIPPLTKRRQEIQRRDEKFDQARQRENERKERRKQARLLKKQAK